MKKSSIVISMSVLCALALFGCIGEYGLQSESVTELTETSLLITLNEDSTILWGGEIRTIEEIIIESKSNEKKITSAVIQTFPKIPTKNLIELVDRIKASGIEKVDVRMIAE